MEREDLIKKLEEISLPEIETPSHKRKLKEALLNKYFREKRSWEIFDIFRKFAPIGVITIILIILISANLIFPKYSLVKAKEIALKDPQIKEWVEKGAIIKDIEIIKNQAYVLIQPAERIEEVPTKEIPTIVEIRKEEFNGALAEVNMKEKEIAKIEKLTPIVITLTEKEEEKIKEIAEKSPEIQEVIPKEAEILQIKSPSPQFKLIRKGNSVQVLPETEDKKKASIIYKFDKKQWEGKVNLSEEKVEEVKFLGEIEE